ncbi:hypothetical protein NL676_011049 [Syzygium grande]|nr:hypothetical protein NL676_011049 [Syzygium grande]
MFLNARDAYGPNENWPHLGRRKKTSPPEDARILKATPRRRRRRPTRQKPEHRIACRVRASSSSPSPSTSKLSTRACINTYGSPHRTVVPEISKLRSGFPAKASKLFDSRRKRVVEEEEEEERMMMVAIMAEIMEEYTAVLTRVLEHLFYEAPLPRRVRILILRSLPFASPPRRRPIGAPAPVPVTVGAA